MAGSILWFWQQQPLKPPPDPVRWEISLYAPAPPAPVQEAAPVPQPVVTPPPKPAPPKPKPKPKPKLKPVQRLTPKPVTRYLAEETPKERPDPTPAPEPSPAPAPKAAPRPAVAAGPAAKPNQPDFGWLQRYLAEKIRRNRHYPGAARSQGLEGRVLVRAVIGSSGDLLSAEILKSSGHDILDEEAVATLRRSTPVPVSEAHHWNQVAITIPFDYHLER